MTDKVKKLPDNNRLVWQASSLCILLASFYLRLTNISAWPAFGDEAIHVKWAQWFTNGTPTYPFLMDGRFLFIVLLSNFTLGGPAPLWIGRVTVVIFSTLTCATCIGMGQLVGSRKTGLLAALIYTLMPFAVFYDRQLLADSLMTSFGALTIAITVRLRIKRRIILVLAFAALMFAAIATKINGLAYLAFPLVSICFSPRSRAAHRKLWVDYAAGLLLSILFAIALVTGFYSRLGTNSGFFSAGSAQQSLSQSACTFPPCINAFLQAITGRLLRTTVSDLLEMASLYFGWPVLLAAVAAWLTHRDDRRILIAVISLSTLGLFAFFMALGSYPRHLVSLTMPLSVLAAVGISSVSHRISLLKANRNIHRFVVYGGIPCFLFVFTAGLPLLNTFNIVLVPDKASLTSLDEIQYRTGYYSGTGIDQAAHALLDREATPQARPIVIVSNIHAQFVSVYFDLTRTDLRIATSYPDPPADFDDTIRDSKYYLKATSADILQWLSEGRPLYIIDQVVLINTVNGASPEFPYTPADPAPYLIIKEIAQYPRRGGTHIVRLRQIIGAEPALRDEVFREQFSVPQQLSSDYQALVATLPKEEATALLVYPPHQASALSPFLIEHPNISIYPIGNFWPLDITATEAQIARISSQYQQLRVVFLEETKGDPKRAIETWLNTHLFRIDEQWFGPLRVVGFARSGQAQQTFAAGARFGDAITLETVEVLDEAPQAGGLVRLRLHWRAETPGPQSYKVFVHIFTADRIIAQHDGQPVGELRPTSTWQANETVVDQFAVTLPADVQPGIYQLRIGLYDIITQARLPVIFSDGTSGEFYVGGQITIRGPEG